MDRLEFCSILNTNITVTDMETTVDYLIDNLDGLRGEYICVSNVHTTVSAFRDEVYRNVQNTAALVLPDGKPLSIVQRKRGFANAGRVPGPDLMPRIFEISKKYGYRHYFYGGKEETLNQLKEKLMDRYPYLNIVGMYSPPFRPLTDEEDKEATQAINDAKPDFIWVALGAPKQENWMYEHRGKVFGIMLGVGAAFDFEAGTVRRAPKWVQELCLEWLYRLLQDPIRLIPRYFSTNFSFLWNVFLENKKIRKEERKLNRLHKKEDQNKYKVAMIGHKRIPSREGGIEVVVEELSTRLVEKGYAVDAYNRYGYHVSGKSYTTNGRRGYYKGIKILTIPTFQNGKLNAIVYSFLATLRALFTRYDVVHVHAEGPCTFLWILKLFGKRVVVTIHGLDWQRAKWGNFATRVLKYGEKQAAKHADEIIVLSKNVQQYFLDTYNRETHYIPNGVSTNPKVEARIITEKFGLKKDKYILFLARLVPEKGLHYLIEAYKKLMSEKAIDTDIKLVIAGGSSHSFEYMEQIDAMIDNDSNIIRTGFVQGRMLEELYSNALMYVLPSDIEGMALTLLEAMSYGNCCLVSDIKENLEVLDTQDARFKAGDVYSLEDKIKQLINNKKLVEELREYNIDIVKSRYSWDDVTISTEKLYKIKANDRS